MTTADQTPLSKLRRLRLTRLQVLGFAALLAPIAYVIGRLSPADWLIWSGLGAMGGLAVGVALVSLISQPAGKAAAVSPTTREMEHSILEELKAELSGNLALFEARKGSTTMYARIEYITGFWEAVKASGRLFVMQDAALLGVIGAAYFWLAQATHLETMAYEAKYSDEPEQGAATAQKLVQEARLLDGQLENALNQAITVINAAL